MKSTGEVEALRIAEATAEAEGTMVCLGSSSDCVVWVTWQSESELGSGLGLRVWREKVSAEEEEEEEEALVRWSLE